VHIVEINPMAVLNARLTAAVGGFEIKPVVGDIRQVELPEDFRDFDWVLWNMPFVEAEATMDYLQGRNFHDGDNGVILTEFLAMLPKLLKPDGTAILLNHAIAEKYIDLPGVTTKVADDAGEITDTTFMLFVVPNPAGR
jgi:methylase of polypeptide subunit release factors